MFYVSKTYVTICLSFNLKVFTTKHNGTPKPLNCSTLKVKFCFISILQKGTPSFNFLFIYIKCRYDA